MAHDSNFGFDSKSDWNPLKKVHMLKSPLLAPVCVLVKIAPLIPDDQLTWPLEKP